MVCYADSFNFARSNIYLTLLLIKWSIKLWRCIAELMHSSTTDGFCITLRWTVSFTPRSIYPLGSSPRHLLDKRLGGPQSWSGHCGGKKSIFPLPEIEPHPSGLFPLLYRLREARGSVVVKALYYKPKGREFDTGWGDFLNLPNPSGLTTPWGLLSL
jgi:hypothetical protein